jgi:hypothetical protein
MNNIYFYRPTLKSFLISLIYDLLPITVAIIVTVSMKKENTVYHKVLNVIMAITSIIMFITTLFAHLNRISIQDQGIFLKRFKKPYYIAWGSIEKANIRERKTLYNGKDKLLILHLYNGNTVSYSISTLSKRHENIVLLEIRKRIPTTEIFDKGII